MTNKSEIQNTDTHSVPRDSRPLYQMFYKVPGRYDLLNRLLAFGFDQVWRKKAADKCVLGEPERMMDLCSGTGDLAIEFARRSNNGTSITAADFCEPMLDVAKAKASRQNIADRIDFRVADAADLPYPENHFDSLGIAFGFRNLTFKNPKQDIYLKEIFRVLKPNGKIVIVETSQPDSLIFRKIFHLYFSTIVATIGGLISGRIGAYRYLAYSAKNYYGPNEIRNLLSNYGFIKFEHHRLMGGISAIYIAEKPRD